MEGAVLQLALGLLEGVAAGVFELVVAELAPVVGLLTELALGLEGVVAQLFADWTNCVRIDS